MNWYWCRQNAPSRGVGIWTRRGGSAVTGNREERVGVEVSKSRRLRVEGKAKKADTLNWIMGKKK